MEDDPEDSWPLLMREVLRRLRRRADRTVAAGLAVAIDLARGYTAAEIRSRHALTEDEYKQAYRWAKAELDAMRQEERASTMV
jgi:predicted N-acyltransferase